MHNNPEEVEQSTQKNTDVVLSHRIFRFFGCNILVYFVIFDFNLRDLTNSYNGLNGLIGLGSLIGLIALIMWSTALIPYVLITLWQMCIVSTEYRLLLEEVKISMLKGKGVIVAYVMFVLYLVLALPHMYASLHLESTWERWIMDRDPVELEVRDKILKRLDFDTTLDFRSWNSGKIYYPGFYIPNKFLHFVSVSD